MVTLDDTDQVFLKDILIKAKATFDLMMTDADVCESNRRKVREYSKMTTQAIRILNGIKE